MGKTALAGVPAMETVEISETILLLPHCLRLSSICKATTGEQGMVCMNCSDDCHVNILRRAAVEAGYQGVCIAPGGSLAMKYVKELKPRGIVAVACDKELSEGVESVENFFNDSHGAMPAITIIPLAREGCIETRVDLDSALEVIRKTS